MKKIVLSLFFSLLVSLNLFSSPMKSFYDFKMKTLDGKEIDFSTFKNKKILIVNVASKCGYTPQYEGLETLYKTHKDELIILGFPANDFGKQEPGTNDEIMNFCQKNYGVTFLMFEKITVKGENQHPLYQWLTKKEQNGWNDESPKWNFYKFLINQKGELVKVFNSDVEPLSKELLTEIEK